MTAVLVSVPGARTRMRGRKHLTFIVDGVPVECRLTEILELCILGLVMLFVSTRANTRHVRATISHGAEQCPVRSNLAAWSFSTKRWHTSKTVSSTTNEPGIVLGRLGEGIYSVQVRQTGLLPCLRHFAVNACKAEVRAPLHEGAVWCVLTIKTVSMPGMTM